MIKNLLLTFCSFIVALLLTEVTIRNIDGMDPGRMWEPHPVLGWRHVAGASTVWTKEGHGLVEINQAGYRDHERTLSPPSDTYRIAIFGDSQTAGFQVNLDETYPAILEEKLRTSGRRVEVLNFGVSGYSPTQEWLLFREDGVRYQPDLVILASFLDNDIAGVDPELTVSQSGIPVVSFTGNDAHLDLTRAEASFHSYHEEPMYTLRKHLATYRLISQIRRNLSSKAKNNNATPGTDNDSFPSRYELYKTPLEERWESAWKTVEDITLRFAQDAQEQGAEFLLLSVPAAQVVTPNIWPGIIANNPAMKKHRWDIMSPEQRFTDFAARNDISMVQPYRVFETHARNNPDKPLFFGNVGHLTAKGHRLLADNLLPVLQNHYDDATQKNSRPTVQ